jgi:hypothetical protein
MSFSLIFRRLVIVLWGLALVPSSASGQTVNWDELRQACPQDPMAYSGSASQIKSMKELVQRHLGATSTSLENITDPNIYRGWGELSFWAEETPSVRSFLVSPSGRVIELPFTLDFTSGEHDRYRSLEEIRSLGVSPQVIACLHEAAKLFHF